MEQTRNRSPVAIATIVVVNITLWMILITAVGMGCIHLNDCPVQPKVPVFLIVMGLSGLFSLMVVYVRGTLCQGDLRPLSTICTTIWTSFLFGWFIAGSHWIYSVYPPNYSPLSKDAYCLKRLYLFAFGLVCVGNLFIGLVVVYNILLLLFNCTGSLLRHRLGFSTYNRTYTTI